MAAPHGGHRTKDAQVWRFFPNLKSQRHQKETQLSGKKWNYNICIFLYLYKYL